MLIQLIKNMSILTIPTGLEPAPLISERLEEQDFYRQYLDFTEIKMNEICLEVRENIARAVLEGRKVNLVVPLNGGLLFYRKLMHYLEFMNLPQSGVNVIFCDEDEANILRFSGDPIDLENAYNLVIDDIWDSGGTGKEILDLLKTYGNATTLDYFAFCKKQTSPFENDGARLANIESVVLFQNRWLHNWGGMNSSLFKDPRITALERTSFLPLVPLPKDLQIKFDTADQTTVEEYEDLLTQTNLAVNGVLPIEVFYDVLYLEEHKNLAQRFEYVTRLHSGLIGNFATEEILPDNEG